MSDFTSIEQRVSYGVGRQLGEQLRNNPFKDFDITAVQAGIADALADAASQVSQEDLQEAFTIVSEKLQAQEAELAKEASAAGQEYLTETAKRDEFTVT
jgi:FKBP-type peptidyl-prolyl cis-trans isomerase FklB